MACVGIEYGVKVNFDSKKPITFLNGPTMLATRKAFVTLFKIGISDKPVLCLMCNEYVRERLDLEDNQEIWSYAGEIRELLNSGLKKRDFVILRSLGYLMYQIERELPKVKEMGIEDYLISKGYDLDSLCIESVYGITSNNEKVSYIDWDELI